MREALGMPLRIWIPAVSAENRRARRRRWDLARWLFLACCAWGLAAGALWKSGFRFGRHGRGLLVSRDADPIAFWTVVVALIAMGVGMAAYGVWRFVSDGRQE
jgi:hypothetical protein